MLPRLIGWQVHRPRGEVQVSGTLLSECAQRTLQLVVASLVAVGWTGLMVPRAAAASPMAQETAISKWDDAAAARGAVGTYVDGATGELVALLPPSSGGGLNAADASSLLATASSAGLRSRVEPATIDRPTIDSIQATLASLRPSIPQTYTYASYFDPSQQKVVLQSNAPASSFATVIAEFGDRLEYVSGFTLASRHSDSSPHWGGALIVGPALGQPGYLNGCTTGFAVTYNRVGYMLTAGHCFAQGVSTYNGPGLSGYYMGYVYWRAPATVDAELIGGSTYHGDIYTSETAYKPVVGAGDPVVNATGYCASGVTSGTNCGHTDVSNTGQVCEGVYCLSNVSVFTGGVIMQEGDFGGPLYLDGGTEVAARGENIAFTGSAFYAEPWSQLSNYFGITIN